jgi:predicted dehydrogenase
MRALIIGAGRMGVRHGIGLDAAGITEICLADISDNALVAAKEQIDKLSVKAAFSYHLIENNEFPDRSFDLAVVASTASDRFGSCEKLLEKGIRYFLLEKPLAQSYEDVLKLEKLFARYPDVSVSVNMNKRLQPLFTELKKDLNTIPQLKGEKTISINMGAIGIGANGIHYIDLLFFLFDAKKIEIVAGDVEDTLISSGRGGQFTDFGGWCLFKLYDGPGNYLGKVFLSISPVSSAFGAWDIVCTSGRISIHELDKVRYDMFRKEDSQLPVYRYAIDYLPKEQKNLTVTPLEHMTTRWAQSLSANIRLLPTITESLPSHELLFKWLAMSRTHKGSYPIT